MAFDRNKYKAAPLKTVQSTVKQSKQYDTFYGEKNEFAKFWSQTDGTTIKRILPAHEPGDSPYVPMLTAQLDVEVEQRGEDRKPTGKKEVKRKKIFIATLHGGFKFDIIEEYIKRVYEKAEQIQDKKDKDKFLAPVTGYRYNGKWVWGIRPQLEYVFYAYIEGKIYRDAFKPKLMEALNRESAQICAQNDEAEIDMFSDPTTGFPLQWTRSKDDKGKTVDIIKSLPPKVGQNWDDFFAQYAVPDKVLEELETLPSLKKIYVNSYQKKDFEMALDGLKRFDENNPDYNIFEQEDFLDMVEEMSKWADSLDNVGIEEGDDDLPFGDGDEEKVNNFDEEEERPVKQKTKAVPGKKATAKKKVNGPTPEEKLAVVNAEFVRQYGDEYEELELEGEELEEYYQKALNKEDFEYDIPHLPGWDEPEEEDSDDSSEEPEPEPESKKRPEKVSKKVAGINSPEDANSPSGEKAIDRIRRLQKERQQK